MAQTSTLNHKTVNASRFNVVRFRFRRRLLRELLQQVARFIDSDRMMLNVASGKGAEQRQVPLSPRLLEALREYWRKYRPTDFLFPGKTANKPYANTSIQKAIKVSAKRAGITKRVYPHVLRHSATGLLEAGVDLLTISRLLGHASFTTTMVYLHCRRENLNSIPSPLDWLPVRQLPTYQPPAENDSQSNKTS